MAKRFNLGGGMRFSLKAMHSSRGTRVYSMLGANKKKAWASWDSKHSRPAIMKQWGTHGRGGSHKH